MEKNKCLGGGKGSRKGQVTIFIISALLIVFAVVMFFVLKNNNTNEVSVPDDLQVVYNTFLSCLEDEVLTSVEIMEFQGGYIELPDLEAGSSHIPFSSQLRFAGGSVPYWYYVSGSGIHRTQVPSKSLMEGQISDFVDSRIRNCDFNGFVDEGFVVSLGEPSSVIEIKKDSVDVSLEMDMGISKAEKNFTIDKHSLSVKSLFGKLYADAVSVYDYQFSNLFLEDYALDVLRLYAPVDGVELSCSPKIWNADVVFDDFEEAIETNMMAMRTNKDGDEDYFYVDLPVDSDVKFVASKNWANVFEVNPSEDNLLIANPVGNQQGLGIIGFCYVPYHFVYNLKFPIMVQVYDDYGEEFFQFPIVVVIDKNKPREAVSSAVPLFEKSELCKFKNVVTSVNVKSNSVPVDANVSYECFRDSCKIGETKDGELKAEFPQCVNGFVVVNADGYEETKQIYSVVGEGIVNVEIKKLYDLEIDLKSDKLSFGGDAVITFTSDKGSKTISYPSVKSVELSEDNYEVQVYAFKDASIELSGGSKEQCVGSGISKRCFEIEIPKQMLSNVLVGGGSVNKKISDSSLSKSKTIQITFERLKTPSSLEDLQNNYLLADNNDLEVLLK